MKGEKSSKNLKSKTPKRLSFPTVSWGPELPAHLKICRRAFLASALSSFMGRPRWRHGLWGDPTGKNLGKSWLGKDGEDKKWKDRPQLRSWTQVPITESRSNQVVWFQGQPTGSRYPEGRPRRWACWAQGTSSGVCRDTYQLSCSREVWGNPQKPSRWTVSLASGNGHLPCRGGSWGDGMGNWAVFSSCLSNFTCFSKLGKYHLLLPFLETLLT